MKPILTLLSLFLLTLSPFALDLAGAEGSTQMTALKIPLSVTSMGRGGAGAAAAEDGAYAFINPAGILTSTSDRFYLAHATPMNGSRMECLNATIQVGKIPVGATLFYRFLGEAPVVVDKANYSGDNLFQAWDGALAFSTGFEKKGMKIGTSLKIIHEAIYDYSSTAYALDGGILATSPVKGLSLGASIVNLGYATAFDKTPWPLTATFRAGTQYEKALPSAMHGKLLFDAALNSDGTLSLPVGLEAGNRYFKLRTGYHLLNDTQTFSAGFSICLSSFSLDYAYSARSNNLTDDTPPHAFALSFFIN